MARNRDDVFESLADSTRRRILELLRGRELAAGEIAAQFALRRPGISKHLTMLKGAGLVSERRQRQRRLYRLRREAVDAALEWLGGLQPPEIDVSLRQNARTEPAEGADLPGVLETRRAAATTIEPVPLPRPTPRFELEFD